MHRIYFEDLNSNSSKAAEKKINVKFWTPKGKKILKTDRALCDPIIDSGLVITSVLDGDMAKVINKLFHFISLLPQHRQWARYYSGLGSTSIG